MTISNSRIVLAAAAHPDDIEFLMAGTLLDLKHNGYDIHMWNIADGSCGTDSLETDQIVRIRAEEAKASADIAGAKLHPSVTKDIEILYEKWLVAKAAALVRRIKPNILLVPSTVDYMEDHQNAGRIMVTAAFVRGMRNYMTSPPEKPWNGPIAVYHAMPHGLRDPFRKRIRPGQYVDIGGVLETKEAMLGKHVSQKEWLDRSQGIGAYIGLMKSMAREVGTMSGVFEYAEGWRRRSHWGFGSEDYDPLSDALMENCLIDQDYEASLE